MKSVKRKTCPGYTIHILVTDTNINTSFTGAGKCRAKSKSVIVREVYIVLAGSYNGLLRTTMSATAAASCNDCSCYQFARYKW